MDLRKAFGNSLRRFRTQKGLSQEYFSDVSSRTYMSSLERGQKSPTIDKVDVIAAAIGVHPLSILAEAYISMDEHLLLGDLLARIDEEVKLLQQMEISESIL